MSYETLPPPDPNATYTPDQIVEGALETLKESQRMFSLLGDQAADIQKDVEALNQKVKNLQNDISMVREKPDFIIKQLEALLSIKI